MPFSEGIVQTQAVLPRSPWGESSWCQRAAIQRCSHTTAALSDSVRLALCETHSFLSGPLHASTGSELRVGGWNSTDEGARGWLLCTRAPFDGFLCVRPTGLSVACDSLHRLLHAIQWLVLEVNDTNGAILDVSFTVNSGQWMCSCCEFSSAAVVDPKTPVLPCPAQARSINFGWSAIWPQTG